MSFAATWMDLESLLLKSDRGRQIPYDTIYIWNLKNYTNNLMYKTETDPQTKENKTHGYPSGKWRRDKLEVWD